MENHKSTPGVAQVPAGTPTHDLRGKTFIGGKSAQFQRQQRPESGEPRMAPPPTVTEEKQAPEGQEVEKEKCSACSADVEEHFLYCSTCGNDLSRKNVCKALGVELGEDDISEYLFKGYLAKNIPLIKGKMATFKTLLPAEAHAAEEQVVEKFKDKDATNAQWSNVYAQVYLSHGWIKFDGQSLGDTPEKRLDFINNKIGVHLLDIASKKWSLFNRAVATLLEDPDAIKNS